MISIMQPYLFPYIGYFQLISNSDCFVVLDDVNYIKKGWINRNKLMLYDVEKFFTVPLQNASQNVLIKDTKIAPEWAKRKTCLYKSIYASYNDSLFFKPVFKLVNKVFEIESDSISEMATQSIIEVCKYLKIDLNIHYSTPNDLKAEAKIIAICKEHQADSYLNMIDGKKLYNVKNFNESRIALNFLKPITCRPISILHLMFNMHPTEIRQLLKICEIK